MKVIICGGGIIGASTAYFLSGLGAEVTIIERTSVACAASGKSGGFLALDWNDHSPLARLARRSFELHCALAAEHDGQWGFRRVDTLSVAASMLRSLNSTNNPDLPSWIEPGAALQGKLGSPQTTAQVIPADFTKAMADLAVRNGAALIIGEVEGIELTPAGNQVSGVRVNGERLVTDSVVVAMGPWSILARSWLPIPPVYGLKGNSIVYRPESKISAHAVFSDIETADQQVLSPEIYPRPDGTVYVCGLSSQESLPADPANVSAEADRIERLHEAAISIMPSLEHASILARQACYRPVCADGLPIIGPIGCINGAYVATGHSVWGILNAPATGEALAQLIVNGVSDIDLSPFQTDRIGLT